MCGVRSALSGAILLTGVPAALLAQAPDPDEPVFAMRQLAEGVWAAEVVDAPPVYAFANSLVVIGADGVLVVDAQASRAASRALLAEVLSRTDAPVRWLVNTHAHGDHLYGNVVWRDAFPDIQIIAHQSLRDGFDGVRAARERELAELPPSIEARRDWLRTGVGPSGDSLDAAGRAAAERSLALREAQLADLAGTELVPPTITFTRRMDLRVGERTVVLLHPGPAHTAGDVVVHLPADGILAAGDLLEAGLPYLADESDLAGWARALHWLATLDAATILPAHGTTLTDGRLLDAQRRLFAAALAAAGSDATICPDDSPTGAAPTLTDLRGEFERDHDVRPTAFDRWFCDAVARGD